VVIGGGDAAFTASVEQFGIVHENGADTRAALAPGVDVAIIRATPQTLKHWWTKHGKYER